MNWHKTNLALIAILLLINIFMAIMLVDTYKDTRLIPKEMISLSRENLESKGIFFKDDSIDKEIKNQKVYTFSDSVLLHETEDGEQSRKSLVNALAFLSGKSRQNVLDNVQYFEIPEGITAAITEKDGSTLTSVMISGKTSESDTDFRYIKPGFDYNNYASAIGSIYSYQNDVKSISCPGVISSFVKNSYDGEIGVLVKSHQKSGDIQTYLCSYTIDGIEIKDMSTVFCIQNGKLVFISGNFFFDLPKAEYSARTVDGVNILFGIENIPQEISIVSEHMVYSVLKTENSKNYLVPTWVVSYQENDTKSTEQTIKTITFNALTGKQDIQQ